MQIRGDIFSDLQIIYNIKYIEMIYKEKANENYGFEVVLCAGEVSLS